MKLTYLNFEMVLNLKNTLDIRNWDAPSFNGLACVQGFPPGWGQSGELPLLKNWHFTNPFLRL